MTKFFYVSRTNNAMLFGLFGILALASLVLTDAGIAGPSFLNYPSDFVEVSVDGASLRKFPYNGSVYVEAAEAREYAIVVRNPFDHKVAVAVTVDGLNSIDGNASTAKAAKKWLINPKSQVTIKGWQMKSQSMSHFMFTNQSNAFDQRTGRSENLGNIRVVYFKVTEQDLGLMTAANGIGDNNPAKATAKSLRLTEADAAVNAKTPTALASTGQGRAEKHDLRQVKTTIESTPIMTSTLRYEFSNTLIYLGVVPNDRDKYVRSLSGN